MKRLAWLILGLVALALSACAPTVTVADNVVPSLIAISVPRPPVQVYCKVATFGDAWCAARTVRDLGPT